MTHVDLVPILRIKASKARSLKHEYVQLIKHWQRSPKTWDRVRVITGKPSLMGRIVGATGVFPGEYLVEVKLKDLEAWLAARKD